MAKLYAVSLVLGFLIVVFSCFYMEVPTYEEYDTQYDLWAEHEAIVKRMKIIDGKLFELNEEYECLSHQIGR